jgi:hypothetical protein
LNIFDRRKNDDENTIIGVETEGRRKFFKEIEGKMVEPLFFCDHCEEPE